MPDHFDIPEGKLIEVSGANPGKEVVLDKDRATFGNLAIIDRVQGLYLLRALTEEGVKVSDRWVHEKILELNDRVSLGNTEIEFSSRQVAGVAPAHAEKQQHQTRLLIVFLAGGILAMGAISLFLPHKTSKRTSSEKSGAPSSLSPVVSFRQEISEEGLVEKIKKARIQFEIADRFYSDASAADANLYLAVYTWQQLVHDLEGVRPEPPIFKEAREHMTRAQAKLEERLEYLKNNAHVAHEIGDQQALRSILQQIMDAIPDRSNKHYQWAQAKLLALPPGKTAKS